MGTPLQLMSGIPFGDKRDNEIDEALQQHIGQATEECNSENMGNSREGKG